MAAGGAWAVGACWGAIAWVAACLEEAARLADWLSFPMSPCCRAGHPVHCLAACKGGQGERLCDYCGPCPCLPAGRAPAARLLCNPPVQVAAALLPEPAGERPGPPVAHGNSGDHPWHARATCMGVQLGTESIPPSPPAPSTCPAACPEVRKTFIPISLRLFTCAWWLSSACELHVQESHVSLSLWRDDTWVWMPCTAACGPPVGRRRQQRHWAEAAALAQQPQYQGSSVQPRPTTGLSLLPWPSPGTSSSMRSPCRSPAVAPRGDAVSWGRMLTVQHTSPVLTFWAIGFCWRCSIRWLLSQLYPWGRNCTFAIIFSLLWDSRLWWNASHKTMCSSLPSWPESSSTDLGSLKGIPTICHANQTRHPAAGRLELRRDPEHPEKILPVVSFSHRSRKSQSARAGKPPELTCQEIKTATHSPPLVTSVSWSEHPEGKHNWNGCFCVLL